MAELMTASRQWASRPMDQRFTSLVELDNHCQYQREHCMAKVISSRGLTIQPVEEDAQALVCVGPNGGPVNITNWSFGQLAQRAGAPAGYLRELPAPLAADCVNYGLKHQRDIADIGCLLYKNSGPAELRAVTGPSYGRVWNSTITRALVNRFGDGVTGDFKVPGEFGHDVVVTKENTTLYASDRDMFVFLADEKHRIDNPNRRDGKSGSLARGFFVWNSEVGKCTMGIATFLFDYVCCNRIVWGAEGYQEIKIRHTSSAPDRWIEEVALAIELYANSSTDGVVKCLEAAKQARIDDVDKFLVARFTKSQATAIKAAHLADEQRPIETLWDATTGITAYARSVPYQDQRVDLERKAGAVFALAV
jgi:Domain of unknown function (DUF932)